jgi:hypothetical protein
MLVELDPAPVPDPVPGWRDLGIVIGSRIGKKATTGSEEE